MISELYPFYSISIPPIKGSRIIKERRYDLDWLRVLSLAVVFIAHCIQLFGVRYNWFIRNPESSLAVDYLDSWINMWIMSLFFAISGAGSWYALRSRSNKQYIQSRVKRILLPIYTVGLFIYMPTVYFFLLPNSGEHYTNFWPALGGYFATLVDFGLNPLKLIPTPYTGSYWFIKFLFLFTLVTLPLFNYLRTKQGLRLIDKLAGWFSQRGGFFIPLIPLIIIRVALQWRFPSEEHYAAFTQFCYFFVIGFIMVADKRFTLTMIKQVPAYIVLGLVSYVATVLAVYTGYYDLHNEPFSLRYVLFETVYAIGRWSWVVVILGLGAKYLSFNNDKLPYWNEAVLPFYLLHETVFLSVAYFLVKWNLGIFPKILILILGSFAIIMLLYHFIVRRFSFTRLIFGMGPKRK
jgi:glucan biosynthesis protein C